MSNNLQYAKWCIGTIIKSSREYLFDFSHRKNGRYATDIKALASMIRKQGYAVIPGYYSIEKCKNLRDEIDSLILKYPHALEVDEHQSDHRLFGADHVSSPIREFFSDPFLRKIGECFLGYELTNYMTLAARLQAAPHNLGSGGGWHRDSTYKRTYKALIYLSDVGEDNGPYQYVPGSNSLSSVLGSLKVSLDQQAYQGGFVNLRYTEDHAGNLFASQSTPVTITGRAGTVILTATQGMHRGMPIKEGARYALTNYYIGAHRISESENNFSHLIKLPHQ